MPRRRPRYSPEQRQNIALARRKTARDPRRVQLALLEAMAVEANFRNLDYGDRDSEGVLQQRPSQGWGPTSESAATDIDQFLARARRLQRQGFRGTAGNLAQAVQRSAYPGRYDERGDEVALLLRGGPPGAGSPSSPPGPAPASASTGGAEPRAALRKQLVMSLIGHGPDTPDLLETVSAIGRADRAPEETPTAVSDPSTSPRPLRRPAGAMTLKQQLASLGVADAITSGVRTHAQNRATGGSSTSYHLPGGPEAYDLDPDDPQIPRLTREARRNPGQFREVFGPADWHIKNGKLRRGRFPGHDDHWHFAR